jgi:spermidine synthase
MPKPFKRLESVVTPEGPLELHQRGERDFLLTVGGRVLMTSAIRHSEIELAQQSCAHIRERSPARVLIGGLGLGYTLRAALDALRTNARVTVAELNPVVVRWCRGPLSILTDNCLADPRVRVVERDVLEVVREAVDQPEHQRYDAIIWDLYCGPGCGAPRAVDERLYGAASVKRAHQALNPGGVFAVWGEKRDPKFETRLTRCGFHLEQTENRGKGVRHAVYIAIKDQLAIVDVNRVTIDQEYD